MSRPVALFRSPEWQSWLLARIGERASISADAVRHATGIYLPNRAHVARVAIKKLRYAVEVAEETGVWRPRRMVKDLGRIQSTLGAMHDAQVLTDALDGLVGSDSQPSEAAALKRVLDDDIVRQHSKYLRRRDRVFAINDACQRAVRSGVLRSSRSLVARSSRSLVAASVVALPLVVLGRRQMG